MTAKYYFRNLSLHELGFSADKKALELKEYISNKLSNLTAKRVSEENIFYYDCDDFING